jgi:hypothetical protein
MTVKGFSPPQATGFQLQWLGVLGLSLLLFKGKVAAFTAEKKNTSL